MGIGGLTGGESWHHDHLVAIDEKSGHIVPPAGLGSRRQRHTIEGERGHGRRFHHQHHPDSRVDSGRPTKLPSPGIATGKRRIPHRLEAYLVGGRGVTVVLVVHGWKALYSRCRSGGQPPPLVL